MREIDTATAIGIVYHDQQLTIAVRSGSAVTSLEQHENLPLNAALVPLQKLHQELRPMNPAATATGRDATLLIDALASTSVHALPCGRFDWLINRSTTHANTGSQLLDEVQLHIARGTLTLPREHAHAVVRDLEKFREHITESGNGFKFPHPDVMTATLGYFPAKLLAVLLAALPGNVPAARHSYGHMPGTAAPSGGYGGHDPFGGGLFLGGHDPFQSFGHDPF